MKNKIITVVLVVIFIGLLVLASSFVNNYNLDSDNEKTEMGENIITNSNNINNNENNIENEILNNDDKLDKEEINEDNNKEKESEDMEILEMTKENFEAEVLDSEKTVLIDFYADWCGPCKMMAPVVERIASENPDLKVVKVNIDKEEELAIKFMVMSIPTFVVVRNGEEVNRIVGAVDKTELESLIK